MFVGQADYQPLALTKRGDRVTLSNRDAEVALHVLDTGTNGR